MAGNETMEVLEEVLRLQRSGEACVLATVIASRGSSPRKAGARMVIRSDGSGIGSVGGGMLEQAVIAAGLQALASGAGPASVSFTLDETFGHACGGEQTVYLEPLGATPRLLVCGAGHVGRALTTLAAFAGFRVTVVDDRPGFVSSERLPEAAERHAGDYGAVIGEIPLAAADCVVVATPSYAGDLAAVRASLATPARFIGVIGSRRKRETMMTELAGAGYAAAELDRIVMPVGLPIGGDSPREIAVSIVAQLIERRYRPHAGDCRAAACSGPFGADGAVQAAASPS